MVGGFLNIYVNEVFNIHNSHYRIFAQNLMWSYFVSGLFFNETFDVGIFLADAFFLEMNGVNQMEINCKVCDLTPDDFKKIVHFFHFPPIFIPNCGL